MKLAGVLAIACLLEAGVITLELRHERLERAAAQGAADSLAGARADSRRLDSLLAASATADRARRAEASRHVAAHRDTTASLGAAVASLAESAAAQAAGLACQDVPAVQGLQRTARALGDSTRRLLASLRATDSSWSALARGDSLRLDRLQTMALPEIQRQRDDALRRAEQATARAILAERGWPTWRRAATGIGCATAGVSLLLTAASAVRGRPSTTSAALLAGSGAVCSLSLAIR